MNWKTGALMIALLISLRVAHVAFPSLWFAAALLLVAGVVIVAWAKLLQRREIPVHGAVVVALGALANGLVILVNGGVMPVHGASSEVAFGAWRSADEGGHLLFLADRMSLGGASPGDLLIATGIMYCLSIILFRGIRGFASRLQLRST